MNYGLCNQTDKYESHLNSPDDFEFIHKKVMGWHNSQLTDHHKVV
jgi:hypothetical protein